MKNTFGKLRYQILLSACLISIGAAHAQAQTAPTDVKLQKTASNTSLNITHRFTPQPSSDIKLDFENWNHFLPNIVLYMGPAIRKRAPKVVESGTRIVARDNSIYRYEGNKVIYTLMHSDEKAWLKTYVRDLETLSTQTEITTLSRQDQLAYWYNLHNAAVISHIAEHYPVRFPEKLTPLENNSALFHDAKILNVGGTPLSLRDIREKIVYPHWTNPLVAYGFHHGNLGGPSIAPRAYERDSLNSTLRLNANEFINSFRSYRLGKISRLYETMLPFYFPNGESDIRAHLKQNMRPEVYKLVDTYGALGWHRPLPQTADVAGGVGFGNSPVPTARVGQGGAGLPPAFSEIIIARADRIRIARQQGLLRGTVTIDDVETQDVDLAEPVD